MSGRCRRAASIPARTLGPRRYASCARKPISPRWNASARSPNGSLTTSRADIVGQAWSGKYRGQTQKWFALRFTGTDSEIDVEHPAGGEKAEFAAWRWEKLQNLPDLVVPFKRKVYERVVEEFAKFA